MAGTSWFCNYFWCGSRLRGIIIFIFNPGDEIKFILASGEHIIASAHISYFVILSLELSLSKEQQLEKESDLFSWTLKSKHDQRNTVQFSSRTQVATVANVAHNFSARSSGLYLVFAPSSSSMRPEFVPLVMDP